MFQLGLKREKKVWTFANNKPLGSFSNWADGWDSFCLTFYKIIFTKSSFGAVRGGKTWTLDLGIVRAIVTEYPEALFLVVCDPSVNELWAT